MRWRQMQGRIAWTFIGLLSVTLLGLSLVLIEVFRTSYLATLEQSLTGQAHLIAASAARMQANIVPALPYTTMVKTLQPDPQTRLTFIAADGAVLADSHLPISAVVSTTSRPEVRTALQGLRGADIRFMPDVGETMFFVALPVTSTAPLRVVRLGVSLTTIHQAEAKIVRSVVIAASLAALLAIALAFWSARQITQPLLNLRTMATRLAAGEVDVVMPIPRDETVADVARDFNEMAAQVRGLIASREAERQRLSTIIMTMADAILLVNADDQIIVLNPAAETVLQLDEPALPIPLESLAWGPLLLRQIRAARLTADGGVQHAEVTLGSPARVLRSSSTCLPAPDQRSVLIVLQDLTELRQAEVVRRTVLTNITHDLRTPLASLQLMIETLQDGALDDRRAATEFLGRMDAEVQHLSHLVTDVLDLARLESGALRLELHPVALDSLLAGVVERMALQAAERGVAMDVVLPPALPLLRLDARRMEQVLLNLLANAVRFTPAGGSVTTSVELTPASVEIAVRDTGSGIAAADLPHIFERFFKADQSRQHGGAGVGLSIVQAIVQHHGGTVSATSAMPGGTTVTVRLPRDDAGEFP